MRQALSFFLVCFLVGGLFNLPAKAALDETTKTRALAILDRIEKNPGNTENNYLAYLKDRIENAKNEEKLWAQYQLLYYYNNDIGEKRKLAVKLEESAQQSENDRYVSLAKNYLAYMDFRESRSKASYEALKKRLNDANRQDWLVTTQLQRNITYAALAIGKKEAAVQTLGEAFSLIPDADPKSNFARLSLLSGLLFIEADSGDIDAMLETANQILTIAETTNLPVQTHEILRNFAYLLRLRSEYGMSLQFYQAYEQALIHSDDQEPLYLAYFGEALAAHGMKDYALSAKYAMRILEMDGATPYYGASMQLVQAVNYAKLGNVAEARIFLEKATDYFENTDNSAFNDIWRVELIRARAEIAYSEGNYDKAHTLWEEFLSRYVETLRAESSADIKSIRADLSAEIAREQAERELLEREQELADQRLKAQTIILGLLALIVIGLAIAYGEQRRISAKLDEARKKAEAASAAKSRFLANMSHELRTPLNAIIGFSELLTISKSDPETLKRQKDYAELIHQSGCHLLDIINDILNIAQVEAGGTTLNIESCSFRHIAEEAIEMVAQQTGVAPEEITLDLPQDLPKIRVDRLRLSQVIINLLGNAVKFSDPPREIALRGHYTPGGLFSFTIEDNGVGIPPEKIDSVLEPFTQVEDDLNRRHQGVGLGLAIVKALVELHNGELSIESKVGAGTKVTVILPFEAIEQKNAGSGRNGKENKFAAA